MHAWNYWSYAFEKKSICMILAVEIDLYGFHLYLIKQPQKRLRMLGQELLSLKEYFFFCPIRVFFLTSFWEFARIAILPKVGFKPFNNGLFHKKNQKTGGLLSHPLESLRPKTKTPEYSTFLTTSGSSTLFLINPWKFLLEFRQYPWQFHILNPPVSFSGIAQWRNALIPHYQFKLI